jgi:hypothetical protein
MSERPNWLIQRGGQQLGPMTWTELAGRARRGELAPMDPVWQEGMPSWVPAHTVAGLFPPAPAAAAPGARPAKVPGATRTAAFAPPPTAGRFARARFHIARAAAWNLRAVGVLADEERALLDRGVDDPAARNYLAYRRSVLLVVGWMATINALLFGAGVADQGLTDLGTTLEGVRGLAFFVLPVTAFLAARSWTRHRRSRRIVTWGWTVTFLTPLLLELVPSEWRIQAQEGQARALVGVLGAIKDFVVLMPAVLALVPGVLRACLRVKVLLPESIVPGWFLVGATPLYVFLFLVVFAVVNQVASDPFLVVGVLLVTSGPLLYLLNVGLLTRPIAPGADFQRLVQVQRRIRYVLEAGVVFLLIWLFGTGHLLGRRIIGLDEGSLARPWSPELLKFPLEFGSHSLYTMTLVADAIMAMNLSVWQHMKQFMGTPAAKDYDRTMQEVNEAGEAG